ncbi:MAG: hypothetical protein JSW06_11565 [Thermoplasmatales archaeon]|nr:MAG: hypothetical protein JSW06_11565 [Thermoplasmatales archaeon]
MNKTLLMVGCIVVYLTAFNVVNAQILSPVAHLEGTIDPDTKAYFVGSTSFSGDFQGYPIDYLESNPLFEEINAFPLFGSSIFKDIVSVTIFDIETIDNQSLEDILNLSTFGIRFTDVTIFAKGGLFVLGANQGNINTNSDLNYAISSIVSFEIDEGNNIPFLAVITISQMNMHYVGESALLVQPSDNGSIIIEDFNGNKLWNENSSNKIFYIEDESFSFVQDSPLYLFPLMETSKDIELSISPAESYSIDIYSLLEDVTKEAEGFGEIPDFYDKIQGFDEIISTASTIVNGGMILVDTNDRFTVDNSHQTFSSFGFARGDKFQVTISSRTSSSTINGEYKLIFLGDHLYTSQAKESENGVAFPFILVFVWAVAIGLYHLFRFYLKKDTNKELDEKVKRYASIFHIIALIIAFILMDREISYQFGISAIDALLGQGISLVLAVFIIVELIMWILGYISLAIPIHIITMSGLKMIGIGKKGKGIGKGIGALFIWVFCTFYIKLIINLILLIMNPSNFFQMG